MGPAGGGGARPTQAIKARGAEHPSRAVLAAGPRVRAGKVRGCAGAEPHPGPAAAASLGRRVRSSVSGPWPAEIPDGGRCFGRPPQAPPCVLPRPLRAARGPHHPGAGGPWWPAWDSPGSPEERWLPLLTKREGGGGGSGRSFRNAPNSARRALHCVGSIFPGPPPLLLASL